MFKRKHLLSLLMATLATTAGCETLSTLFPPRPPPHPPLPASEVAGKALLMIPWYTEVGYINKKRLNQIGASYWSGGWHVVPIPPGQYHLIYGYRTQLAYSLADGEFNFMARAGKVYALCTGTGNKFRPTIQIQKGITADAIPEKYGPRKGCPRGETIKPVRLISASEYLRLTKGWREETGDLPVKKAIQPPAAAP